MAEPINKVKLNSQDEYIEVGMAVRSDGMFVLLFNKPVATVNFNPIDAAQLRDALNVYLQTRVTGA